MKHRLFIDTNVMIDFLAHREPFCDSAQRVFSLAKGDSFTLVVASLSFSTAAYIMEHKMKHDELTSLLRRFASLVEVAAVDESVVKSSIAANCQFKDIEDAMQNYVAITSHCEAIITRNTKDFAPSSLLVCTPSEFLEEYDKRLS